MSCRNKFGKTSTDKFRMANVVLLAVLFHAHMQPHPYPIPPHSCNRTTCSTTPPAPHTHMQPQLSMGTVSQVGRIFTRQISVIVRRVFWQIPRWGYPSSLALISRNTHLWNVSAKIEIQCEEVFDGGWDCKHEFEIPLGIEIWNMVQTLGNFDGECNVVLLGSP